MIYLFLAHISRPLVFLISFFAKRKPGSILVFQTAKIGDMICTSPVFREIKKAYPSARLGVVVDPVAVPLLKHNPHVDEIIVFDRGKYRGLGGKLAFARLLYVKGYASALILMPNVTNIVAPFWAGIPRRVAVHPDFAGSTLKRLLGLCTSVEYHTPPRMAMETYLRSLRHFGIEKYTLDKDVFASPGAEEKAAVLLKGHGPFAGLVLGTGNELKDWGKDNFMTLAGKMLSFTGATIVLLGSGKERPIGEEVVNYTKDSRRVLNLCGSVTLDEAPALIKRMSVVVGVDTGLVYMADALNVPVVVIAGPCDMNDQRPTGKRTAIIQEKGFECVPCSHTFLTPYACRHNHKQCVMEIAPDEVLKAAMRLLSSNPGAARA